MSTIWNFYWKFCVAHVVYIKLLFFFPHLGRKFPNTSKVIITVGVRRWNNTHFSLKCGFIREMDTGWQQSPPHPRGSRPLEKQAPVSVHFLLPTTVACFHISLPIAIGIFYFDNYHFSGRELLSLKKKPFWGKKKCSLWSVTFSIQQAT